MQTAFLDDCSRALRSRAHAQGDDHSLHSLRSLPCCEQPQQDEAPDSAARSKLLVADGPGTLVPPGHMAKDPEVPASMGGRTRPNSHRKMIPIGIGT